MSQKLPLILTLRVIRQAMVVGSGRADCPVPMDGSFLRAATGAGQPWLIIDIYGRIKYSGWLKDGLALNR